MTPSAIAAAGAAWMTSSGYGPGTSRWVAPKYRKNIPAMTRPHGRRHAADHTSIQRYEMCVGPPRLLADNGRIHPLCPGAGVVTARPNRGGQCQLDRTAGKSRQVD